MMVLGGSAVSYERGTPVQVVRNMYIYTYLQAIHLLVLATDKTGILAQTRIFLMFRSTSPYIGVPHSYENAPP